MSAALPVRAVAVFQGGKVRGTVHFTEVAGRGVRIDVDVTGLKRSAQHGFHVHECGDLTAGCESMCAHFNPYGKSHGCPGKRERHVGDLGNLVSDAQGVARYTFYDDVIRLRGTAANIVGRGLIVHADPDDCGEGNHPTSKTTGNSGKRIACAVVGYAKPPVV
jgi:superoxide dismutase, Cu-Zn family